MSKELLTGREPDAAMFVILLKALKRVIKDEKVNEIVREAADKWAEHQVAKQASRIGQIASAEEFVNDANKKHEAKYGRGVFPFEIKKGKIEGSASSSICPYGEYVKEESILCEFCRAFWRKFFKSIFPRMKELILEQSYARGTDNCVIIIEY